MCKIRYMNTKVAKTTSEKISEFMSGKLSVYIFSSLLVLIALIQIIIFACGGTISGLTNSEDGAWVAWVYMIISFPFGIFSVLATIYTIRRTKNFLVFAYIIEFGYAVSSFAGGMMFSGLIIFVAFALNTYRYTLIKSQGSNYEVNKVKVWTIVSITMFILILFGVITIHLDTNNVFWWNTGVYDKHHLVQYIDVIGGTMAIVGVALTLTKNKHAFTVYIVCDIFYLILFAKASQWTSFAIIFIAIIMEVLGYIVWHCEGKKKAE